MKTYVHPHGFDVWRELLYECKAPTTPLKNKDGNKLEDNDYRAKNAIMNGLIESVYTKVVHCESTK